jgi:hypothetical protein
LWIISPSKRGSGQRSDGASDDGEIVKLPPRDPGYPDDEEF